MLSKPLSRRQPRLTNGAVEVDMKLLVSELISRLPANSDIVCFVSPVSAEKLENEGLNA